MGPSTPTPVRPPLSSSGNTNVCGGGAAGAGRGRPRPGGPGGPVFRDALLALTESGACQNELAVDPRHVLRLATIEGVRALGLETGIGSLEPGKQADVTALDLRDVNLGHFFEGDPAPLVLYSAKPANVKLVVAGGRLQKRDGQLLGVMCKRRYVRQQSPSRSSASVQGSKADEPAQAPSRLQRLPEVEQVPRSDIASAAMRPTARSSSLELLLYVKALEGKRAMWKHSASTSSSWM